jgi:ABC-type branched-subunit amino acid transport system permease subunit
MIWAIDLLLGDTGLPAFGDGAFLGIGGYLLGMSQKWRTGGAGPVHRGGSKPAPVPSRALHGLTFAHTTLIVIEIARGPVNATPHT